MSEETKTIKIPIWLASILVLALLGVAIDTREKVLSLQKEFCELKTALKAKGIIERDLCFKPPETAILRYFDGVCLNQANQSVKKKFN